MKNKREFNENGITLVALVVTIIILIILAVISISALSGSGLFEKTTQSKDETLMKQAEEEIKLVLSEWQIERATKNISLVDFLDKKIKTKEIDEKEEIDENIEIQKNGYVLIVDTEGNILEAIQKSCPSPQISNVKITLEDGTTEVEENSQTAGTKLKINFDSNIKNGKIKTITPELPYITDGTENDIEFKIVGTVEGNDYAKTVKISVSEKYIKSVESLIEGVSEISKSGYKKIQVSTDSETVLYNANVIVYKGDLVLDGQTNVDGSTLDNNTYEFGNAETDVATSTEYAKNMVVLKVNGNLTINEEVTLTACKSSSGYGGPKGMMIYCTGTLTNNGTISMTARGANAVGENVYLWRNIDGSNEYVPAVGANGGKEQTAWSYHASAVGVIAGANGVGRQTGGGGSGYAMSWTGLTLTSPRGGNGTSYSGGAGAGSYMRHGGGYAQPDLSNLQGSDEGGSGGNSYVYWDTSLDVISGGVGNSGGIASRGNERQSAVGTGGLLIIYANELQNNNKISANGVTPNPPTSGTYKAYGSASGGGSINIFLNNNSKIGTLEAKGGNAVNGGAGGVGSKSAGRIVNGTYTSLGDN